MIEVRLALPQRSPMPFSVPCTWRAPGTDSGQRPGDGVLGVVVGVDAEMIAGHMARDLGDDGLDLMRQRAAIGVAEHDPARAGLMRGRGRRPAHSRGRL